MGLYKLYLDASAYPNGMPRCLKVGKGDSIYVIDSTPYSIGEKYKNFNATVTEIICEDKKWWQFWKRQITHGYVIAFE